MRPLQCIIINALANTSVNSLAIDIRNQLNFSLQVSAGTGSLAGTYQIQVTNDPCETAFSQYHPINWTNLGTPLTFAQSSTASNQLIPKTDISYVALRCVFTDTSGGTNTSTASAALHGQGI